MVEPHGAHRRAGSRNRLKRALLSWSSGKDSAWALHLMRSGGVEMGVEIAGLLTTFNQAADRVAMHAVRWYRSKPRRLVCRYGPSSFRGPVPMKSTSRGWLKHAERR